MVPLPVRAPSHMGFFFIRFSLHRRAMRLDPSCEVWVEEEYVARADG